MLVPHHSKDPPDGQNVLDHEQLSSLEHPIPMAFPGNVSTQVFPKSSFISLLLLFFFPT